MRKRRIGPTLNAARTIYSLPCKSLLNLYVPAGIIIPQAIKCHSSSLTLFDIQFSRFFSPITIDSHDSEYFHHVHEIWVKYFPVVVYLICLLSYAEKYYYILCESFYINSQVICFLSTSFFLCFFVRYIFFIGH